MRGSGTVAELEGDCYCVVRTWGLSLLRGYWNRNLKGCKGVSHVAVGGKTILGDEGSKCKGPELGASLMGSWETNRLPFRFYI